MYNTSAVYCSTWVKKKKITQLSYLQLLVKMTIDRGEVSHILQHALLLPLQKLIPLTLLAILAEQPHHPADIVL